MTGTRVATAMGWRKIERLGAGDMVLTFDHGMREVTKVTRVRLWRGEGACPRRFWPLEVPAKVLGNRTIMRILPGQAVMLESDIAEEAYGDPFALVRARVLEGIRGIERTPPVGDAEVIMLYFADEQVIFGEDGALFLCPSSRDLIARALDGDDSLYSILPVHEALRLVDQIESEDTCSGPATPQDIGAAVAA
ncbi:Hint domain-containing protein [Roseovarius sp. MMSF_3281]|uniref:Hint domain-containing protein n=1 Tax=Roseovarius sp. MMSF_3281 TaxID=3046694 RepID=UPI00273E0679|nr:Hint domain-containing protein [Roseovarius sp. MMSF_3281]